MQPRFTQPHLIDMLPGMLPEVTSMGHDTIDPVLRAAILEDALHATVSLNGIFLPAKRTRYFAVRLFTPS